MTIVTLESFVKERTSGIIKKSAGWIQGGTILDGESDEAWTAEELAAEAIGAGLITDDITWDALVERIKKVMES